MMTDHPVATIAAVVIAPSPLSNSVRQRIFLYLGVLIILLAFGAPYGGLIDIPISFFLKNRLHLTAHELAGSGSWPPSRSTCPVFSDSSATREIRSGCGTEDSCCCSAPSAPASTSSLHSCPLHMRHCSLRLCC